MKAEIITIGDEILIGQIIDTNSAFIAQELNCQTIAEGVETPEQAMALAAMGVDYLQGYYFAKPMKNEALAEWQNPITTHVLT